MLKLDKDECQGLGCKKSRIDVTSLDGRQLVALCAKGQGPIGCEVIEVLCTNG